MKHLRDRVLVHEPILERVRHCQRQRKTSGEIRAIKGAVFITAMGRRGEGMIKEFGEILDGALTLFSIAKRRVEDGELDGALETLELGEQAVGQARAKMGELEPIEARRQMLAEERRKDERAYRLIMVLCGFVLVVELILISFIVYRCFLR